MISVRLVDPRFYHLDTAMIVLDENTAAYYPAAFDEAGQAALAAHFPELIEAKDADAEALGLNGISDGRNVVLPVQAEGLAREIRRRRLHGRARSTCRSSRRQAAGPSAARWNCR